MASYYVWSGATGSANGTSWANAYTTLTLAFATKAAGDVFYVAHDHSESSVSVALSLPGTVANPCKIICVNRAGSVPPVSADRRATAVVATTTGALTLSSGCMHFDGIIFNGGTTTSNGTISLQNANSSWSRFDNCSLRLVGTSASAVIKVGNPSVGMLVELNNTTVSFSNVVQGIAMAGGLRWRNTPSALLGTIPTTLFLPTAAWGGYLECIGVDLSAAGSGKTIVGSGPTNNNPIFKFVDCKLDAAVTKSVVPAAPGATEVDFIRSGASGNYAVFRHRISGTLDQETTIVRTGGATDGTTPISWKVVTTANCTYSAPFECPPIAIWCDTTGSAKTATIEGIASALPTDSEIWVDVEYLGDATAPQGSFINDGAVDLLTAGANQTTSTATWGGALTGKFKLNVTFTPLMKGWVYCRVKIGKASTAAYIDPLVVLS